MHHLYFVAPQLVQEAGVRAGGGPGRLHERERVIEGLVVTWHEVANDHSRGPWHASVTVDQHHAVLRETLIVNIKDAFSDFWPCEDENNKMPNALVLYVVDMKSNTKCSSVIEHNIRWLMGSVLYLCGSPACQSNCVQVEYNEQPAAAGKYSHSTTNSTATTR